MKSEFKPLLGQKIRLEPLCAEHVPSLIETALAHPGVWQFMPFPMKTEADVRERIEAGFRLAAAGAGVAFVTKLSATGELVGSTAIFAIDPNVPSFEIGATWVVPAWQRSAVNTEAKYLQLCFLFETLNAARVELKTDALNLRSRAAIARIGAIEEGTFRSHMRRADGTLRDSVYFAITHSDWPRVKAELTHKLARGQR